MLATLIAVLTSGAGGGIVGGILALFRTRQESKERVELERISLERDQAEFADRRSREQHEAAMAAQGSQQRINEAQAEGEIASDLANAASQGQALVAEFANLKTSTWVDNCRALVRPFMAAHFTAIFTALLIWAFAKYNGLISPEQGLEILLGLFATLNFAVNAIIMFYFVARRNAAAAR